MVSRQILQQSIQDVSIQRSSSVVQNLRRKRNFIGQLRAGKAGLGDNKMRMTSW